MSSSSGRPAAAPDDPSARPQLSSWYAQGFSDGFGDRLLMFDNAATGPLELLRVRADFAIVPAFEAALRKRVEQLTSFAHPGFAQVRSIDHLEDGDGLTIVSAHVAGTRLSELFQPARSHQGMHPASVRRTLGELIASLADLHRVGSEVAHGTLTADHLVVTADRRIVITDYVFGDALAALRLPAERLIAEFGLVAAASGEARPFDQRGDLFQAAVIVLSLVLGRRISASDLSDRGRLLEEFTEQSMRRAADVTPGLRAWVEEAMDPAGFRNAGDAERALVDPPRALAVAAPAPQAVAAAYKASAPSASIDVEQIAPSAAAEVISVAEPAAAPRSGWLWVAAALAIVAMVQAGIIVRLLSRPVPQPPIARVTIDSATPGDTVLVDGRDVGVTPLDLPLDRVSGPIRVVPQPPEAVPGSVLAMSNAPQPAPPEPAPVSEPPRTGGVRIVSPVAVQVLEGDRVLGSSGNGPVFLRPGTHSLELINNQFGYRTAETVQITAGRIVPLTLTPPNGRISVNAQPWAQVFIDGRNVGDTPLANLSVPLGEHELIFRHPQLGERRQTAIVQADALTRVSVSFTQ